MVGKDFEKGLLALKALAEKTAQANAAAVLPAGMPATVPSVPAPQTPVPAGR
jgi:hypothetical protein